jgi:hypothetical protein
MTDEAELGWLAGIMDGEGTIGMSRVLTASKCKNPSYRPIFQIANTDIRILNRASEILYSVCGVASYIVIANRRKAENINKPWKTGYRLQIHVQRRIARVLPMLIPYLTAKREQAEILLAYCSRRDGRSRHKAGYVDADLRAYDFCRQLNRRGITVESGGESPAIAGEGAFRTTEESVEMAEMTIRQPNLFIN